MPKKIIWGVLGLIAAALFVFNTHRLYPVLEAATRGFGNITGNEP